MAHDPGRVKITLILADSAQSVAGKLYILGGGWNLVQRFPGQPIPMALGMRFEVPWALTNHRFDLLVVLRDAEGQDVDLGDGSVRSQGQFEVGRPPGMTPGMPLVNTLAIQVGMLDLPAGHYVWDLELDGEIAERAAFDVLDINLPVAPTGQGGA